MRSQVGRMRLVLLTATIVLGAAAGVVTTHTRSFTGVKPTTTIEPHSAATGSEQTKSLPLRLVRVFVHEFDLYPNFLKLGPGRILLRAENEKRTEMALILERIVEGQSPQQTARIDVATQQKRVAREITLEAGQYQFYEASNPALKGTIFVDPD